jgi:hypothetical protein
LRLRQYAHCLGKQGEAGRRQGDAAIGAHKQGTAKGSLKRLDGLRQWWLCHMQAQCRPAEVQLFGNGNKIAQLPQFKVHIDPVGIMISDMNIISIIHE